MFLHEGDVSRITAHYADREPGGGVRSRRAQVGAAYSHWPAGQVGLHALPVADCRPWDTPAPRTAQALSGRRRSAQRSGAAASTAPHRTGGREGHVVRPVIVVPTMPSTPPSAGRTSSCL